MNTPTEVTEALARGPALVMALILELPPAVRKWRPRAGKWSGHEHACHVARMEPMWAERVERILAEDNPTIVGYDPATDEAPDALLGLDLATALASYGAGRALLVRRLQGLDGDAWRRPAVHTEHGRYSLFLMCRHLALHDRLHAYRIEEIILSKDLPSSSHLSAGP